MTTINNDNEVAAGSPINYLMKLFGVKLPANPFAAVPGGATTALPSTSSDASPAQRAAFRATVRTRNEPSGMASQPMAPVLRFARETLHRFRLINLCANTPTYPRRITNSFPNVASHIRFRKAIAV
jgi:hypothetical protein